MRSSLLCYAGVDDGYFKRSWRYTVLAAAVHCEEGGGPLRPYYSSATLVRVDGADATYRIVGLVKDVLGWARAAGARLEAILLDTPVYAGFNVADPDYVHEATSTPVIVIYHYEPDRDAVERALARAFPGETWRLEILHRDWARLFRVSCPRGRLLASAYGVSEARAYSVVCRLQLFTRTPEPLYTAGIVASSLSRALFAGQPYSPARGESAMGRLGR